jgi:hypothetical protein
MTTEQLIAGLREALGGGLKSVVLYGSAAAGDFIEGVSGQDVLVVVERLGAEELDRLAAPLERWQSAGNPLPQLFTAAELAGSADVFPIELADMQQSRRVLFGSDPLAEMKIDMELFRLQLERELKTRLILLRQRYLVVHSQPQALTRLMTASISTFLVLVRASLRLIGDRVPASKADALVESARRFNFAPQPFIEILRLKQQRTSAAAGDKLFQNYLASIEAVVQAVDRHLHSPIDTKIEHRENHEQ